MKKYVFYIFLLLTMFLSGCSKTSTQPKFDVNEELQSRLNNSSIDANKEFHRLFSSQIKHKITIEITKDEWNKLNEDMINYSEEFDGDLRSNTYFKARMIYEDKYGSIEVDEVGFRTRGNNSRTLLINEDGTFNLSHFKLKFNSTFDYGKETKNYDLLKDRKIFDLEELILKYNSNNDLAYISELHSYQLMNKVGIFAPLVTLSEFSIKVDDDYYFFGLYNIIEPIDKEFIDKRLSKKASQGNLYKSLSLDLGRATLESLQDLKQIGIRNVETNYRPTYDLKTNKKNPNFNDLHQFINSINTLNGEEFKNYIESNFDVNSFLRLLAINVLIGNPDDYRGFGNNYYLYFNSDTQKFMMIPYDLDQSLGVGKSKYTQYSDIYKWRNNSILFQNQESRPLSDKILNIVEFQTTYENYIKEYINPDNQLYTYDQFEKTFNLFKTIYTNTELNITFNELYTRNFINTRITNVNDQLYYYSFNPKEKGSDIS